MPILLLNCKHQFQYCNKILHLKFYSSPLTSFLPLSPTYYIISLSPAAWHCSDIKLEASPPFTFPFFPSFSEPLAVTCAIEQLSQSNKSAAHRPQTPWADLKPSMPNTTASHSLAHIRPISSPALIFPSMCTWYPDFFLHAGAVGLKPALLSQLALPGERFVLSVWAARLFIPGDALFEDALWSPRSWVNGSFTKCHLGPSLCFVLFSPSLGLIPQHKGNFSEVRGVTIAEELSRWLRSP